MHCKRINTITDEQQLNAARKNINYDDILQSVEIFVEKSKKRKINDITNEQQNDKLISFYS